VDDEEFVMIPEEGAISCENWQAALAGSRAHDAWEYPLYTDAELVGEIVDGFGPYAVLNALTHTADPSVPAAFLRLQYHLTIPLREMNETYDRRYHGGYIQDELTALLALSLGIRLMAGPASRHIQANGDPLGRPWGIRFGGQANIRFVPGHYGTVLPRATGAHEMVLPEPVRRYAELSQDASVAVVRAARLYQEAVWVAESNPAYAWLLLVSALESAAVYWRQQEDAPIDRLRASKPELEQMLSAAGGPELAEQVAEMLAPSLGATKRFIDFTMGFLPDPPLSRPAAGQQHPWTRPALKKSLSLIYAHRSRALHSGIPFPAPMCLPPFSGGDAFGELPGAGGTAAGFGDNVWLARDTPMTFHLFEHIARGALLAWWESLLPTPDTSWVFGVR
jgi:hypothetical protein